MTLRILYFLFGISFFSFFQKFQPLVWRFKNDFKSAVPPLIKFTFFNLIFSNCQAFFVGFHKQTKVCTTAQNTCALVNGFELRLIANFMSSFCLFVVVFFSKWYCIRRVVLQKSCCYFSVKKFEVCMERSSFFNKVTG